MISLSTIGISELFKKLKATEEKLQKRKTANAQAVVIIDKWIQDNFKKEGKGTGLDTPWAPLAKSTKEQRKRKKKGNKILQITGQLRSRWKHQYTNEIAMVQSNVPYAYPHDSDGPRRKLPRRQILPDYKHIEKTLSKIFENFAEKAVK